MALPSSPSPAGWARRCVPRLAALWPEKLLGLAGGLTAFFAAYFWVLHHPGRPPLVMPLVFIDRWVPFLPAALPLYLSLWFYVSLAPSLEVTREELHSCFFAALGLAGCGLGLFYFWPTEVPPPEAVWAPGSLFAFLKNADAAGNACPSLHVAFAVFTAVRLAHQLRHLGAGRIARTANWLWCAGIAWSTLATRQHVFLDVAAGAALGAAFGALPGLRRRLSPAGRPAE
ncbi:MAG TPA: phosphatase PAP2 family protein [Lacunisphaera sp.]|nr:phosphatase PAP2 family protein [Lacunisphaera sp.]